MERHGRSEDRKTPLLVPQFHQLLIARLLNPGHQIQADERIELVGRQRLVPPEVGAVGLDFVGMSVGARQNVIYHLCVDEHLEHFKNSVELQSVGKTGPLTLIGCMHASVTMGGEHVSVEPL